MRRGREAAARLLQGMRLRPKGSLRVQLLAWIVIPLVAVAAVNLWTSWAAADRMADLVTDRTLIASARAIGEAARNSSDTIDVLIPPIAIEMFATGYQDRVYYRVETAAGRLLEGYPDLPTPDAVDGFDPILFEGMFRDQPLHLVALRHPIAGHAQTASIVVVVGVTLVGHAAMVTEIWLHGLGQQLILVAVAAALALVGLARGLRPLVALRDRVSGRQEGDLDPLDPAAVQSELRPLVVALNGSMARVRTQLAAQSRFVQNAAHQLRTPIATLTTQATFALRTGDAAQRTDALVGLRTSAMQLARLAAQLLLLARAEPGSRRPRRDRVDLTEAARLVLESLSQKALDHGTDLGFEPRAEAVIVQGDGTMLREMIVNIVDNAIAYTPPDSAVTLRVERLGASARIQVIDTGPGLPATDRARVFERFYRVAGTAQDGSGLGLAIVREVVDAAGGTVVLSDTPGGGLTVTVTLPAALSPAPPEPAPGSDGSLSIASR